MPNDAENDVVYLKVGDDLPAAPYAPPKYLFWRHLKEGDQLLAIPTPPSPTTEMLKQLLEQMLENERRRLRNEFIRISMFVLLFLAVAIGGGFWFAHNLLDQLRAERQTAERSLQALLQRIAPETLSSEPSNRVPALAAQARDQRSENIPTFQEVGKGSATPRGAGQASNLSRQRQDQQPGEPKINNTSAPILNTDTNTAQAQADIHRILAGLEAKKKTLAKMLSTQNTQTKTLLQSRAGELQTLYERMDEMQRKIMNASPPEVPPAKETLAPSAKEAQASPTIEAKATDSLIVTTTNAVTLRLPIPTP